MRALVATENEAIGSKVRAMLTHSGITCLPSDVLSFKEAMERAGRARYELVVVAMSADPQSGLTLIRELKPICHAALLAVGPADDPKFILQTLRHADEYLDEADLDAEFANTLVRIRTTHKPQVDGGRVIAVVSPSGGSGASTLVANLATVLAQHHGRSALFDLQLTRGDQTSLLDLEPEHTLTDLCRHLERIDQTMFEQLFVRHATGLHLLAAPKRLSDVQFVTPQGVRRGLAMARAMFPYVLVDLDRSLGEVQLEAVAQADLILVVMRLEFTSLRNASRILDHLAELGVTADRARLVVNRYRQPKELSARKVERTLGRKLSHYVPNDPRRINGSNNKGVPVVLEHPSARVSRSLTELAFSVNGAHSTGQKVAQK